MSDTTMAGGPDATDLIGAVTGRNAPRWLFTLTVLVGSFLLFLVQPMIARMALPKLGGAPAVWNSAMLVYQALLLAGYAWAHWIGRFDIRRQLYLHGGLLVAAILLSVFPIGLRALVPPSDSDVFLFVPLLLLTSVGPLILAISAQAPLMQRWFADSAPGQNPYALYAASNLGSFGGLAAYPLLVEPNLRLLTQSWTWSALYVALILLVVACGWAATRAVAARQVAGNTAMPDTAAPSAPRPGWRQIALWIALAAVPSGLMLSTTTHLTTDIMAMPLMWALPLGLYLLSFTFAFSDRSVITSVFTLMAPAILLITGGLTMLSSGTGGLMIATSSLMMLFVVAVALHGRLYELRPATEHLTLFYLVMAVGGALGGLFCALIAPLLFDWVYEHPLLVLAAALLVPMTPLIPWADMLKLNARARRIAESVLLVAIVAIGVWLAAGFTGWFENREVVAVIALVVLGIAAIGWRVPFIAALIAMLISIGGVATLQLSLSGDRTRSYFGVYTVRTYEAEGRRTLSHGTTLHGTQLLPRGKQRVATSYYGPTSGVGLAFARAGQLYGPNAALGVVGLGTGTLACYHEPGQRYTYFEIDPAMERIARDRFSFLSQCAPGARMVIGDARLTLGQPGNVPAGGFDMLAIDAFSSDAIPLHLLTKEAFDVYGGAVKPDGIVLVHISNRFMNLEPVLAALEREGGWHAMLRRDEPDAASSALQRTPSIWVAMARSNAPLLQLARATSSLPNGTGEWVELDRETRSEMWTDDYASVMPLLMWPGF